MEHEKVGGRHARAYERQNSVGAGAAEVAGAEAETKNCS